MNHKVINPGILYFGTPVALLTTLDETGNANIGPMSSVWGLGWTLLLGLECASKTYQNLIAQKECVVNLADPTLFQKVEKIANLTGANPVPEYKKGRYRYERDKFGAAGFSKIASEEVQPPRIAECRLQLESVFRNEMIIRDDPKELSPVAAVEVRVVKVHADESMVFDDKHIDPKQWSPLIYNFRHYQGLDKELGKTFKAEI